MSGKCFTLYIIKWYEYMYLTNLTNIFSSIDKIKRNQSALQTSAKLSTILWQNEPKRPLKLKTKCCQPNLAGHMYKRTHDVTGQSGSWFACSESTELGSTDPNLHTILSCKNSLQTVFRTERPHSCLLVLAGVCKPTFQPTQGLRKRALLITQDSQQKGDSNFCMWDTPSQVLQASSAVTYLLFPDPFLLPVHSCSSFCSSDSLSCMQRSTVSSNLLVKGRPPFTSRSLLMVNISCLTCWSFDALLAVLSNTT